MRLKAWTGTKFFIYKGELRAFNDECQLFKSAGGKWWLFYSRYHKDDPSLGIEATGSFKTKKKAIEWYAKGGR